MLKPELAPTLKLLGGAVIQSGDTPLGGPAAHRHRLALLALLATSGRVMSRDKLVAFLWPERDTESARNLLKTAVHELRKLLGENAIRSTGDQLSIDPAILRCDVLEFEAAVAANDLAKAAALYGGPFLDGFFLKDASEFEHWVDARRLRLAESHTRVIERIAAEGGPRSNPLAAPAIQHVSNVVPVAAPAKRRARRWPVAAASVVAIGVVAALIGSARGGDRASGNGVQLAGFAPVILADDDPGSALLFDGTSANVSTAIGSLVTTQLDNVAIDMLVRFDGPTTHRYQMAFYNGHGAVTGWGLMILGTGDGQPEGTIGILAGGLKIAATSLVLQKGKWQRLVAERRQGKVTVALDDSSYVVGDFPVNPVGEKRRDIERTTIGGDGTFDQPTGSFRGAIDRVRLQDLVSNFSIDRWTFDEGSGPATVGYKGAVLFVGNAQWIAGSRSTARDVFWSRMEALCGHAFAGRLTEGSPADSVLRRSALVIHGQSCTPTEIRIALHVGTDRSRTWVLSRTAGGLRLKHEHRHADGTEDAITRYGGDSRNSGSIGRQEFPADVRTAALIPAARANVWSLDIEPGARFAYSLARGTDGRRVRLEFDLVNHMAAPPPSWGTAP